MPLEPGLRLPPRTSRIQIDYSILSLAAVGKPQFRYRLENFDSDWQDAGERRQASYTNLPPGAYTFRVASSNSDGDWNEMGDTLAFSIQPAFYQTVTFRLAMLAAVLLATWAAWQLRLRSVRRRYDLSSMRAMIHAAAPCPIDIKRRMLEWWGPVVWEYYAATEGGVATMVDAHEWLARPGTVGLPVDTWELDLSGAPAWNVMTTGGPSPPGMYGMASIFDARRDRMIIFGGSTSDGYYGVHNDTWALNLRAAEPSWHKLTPLGTLPAARRTMTSIYDPIRDRMIIYGGWDSQGETTASFLGDAWALSLDNNPAWTQLAPAGTLPQGRGSTAAIYDPVNDQLAVYGGWDGEIMLADTWFLHWGETGQAAAMATSSSASPTNAHVEWQITDNTSPYAAVYRRDGTGPWSSLSIAQADATGHLAFDDATVTAGAQYDYMVVIPSEKGSQFGGQANVTVPTPSIALRCFSASAMCCCAPTWQRSQSSPGRSLTNVSWSPATASVAWQLKQLRVSHGCRRRPIASIRLCGVIFWSPGVVARPLSRGK